MHHSPHLHACQWIKRLPFRKLNAVRVYQLRASGFHLFRAARALAGCTMTICDHCNRDNLCLVKNNILSVVYFAPVCLRLAQYGVKPAQKITQHYVKEWTAYECQVMTPLHYYTEKTKLRKVFFSSHVVLMFVSLSLGIVVSLSLSISIFLSASTIWLTS
jgi:hypothetical protein